jgi:hypothetical protein
MRDLWNLCRCLKTEADWKRHQRQELLQGGLVISHASSMARSSLVRWNVVSKRLKRIMTPVMKKFSQMQAQTHRFFMRALQIVQTANNIFKAISNPY